MRLEFTIDTHRIKYLIKHFFRTEIIYSLDGKYFYAVGRSNERPRDWISIEKDKKDGKHGVLSFAFWKVRSGKKEFVSRKHHLAALYRRLYS